MEIHNLFGKLALDENLIKVIDEIKNNQNVLIAVETILNAVNINLNTISENQLDKEVSISNIPEIQKVIVEQNKLPDDAAKESTAVQTKNLVSSIVTLIDLLINKTDFNNAYVNLVGVKENAALRSVSRLTYDTNGNLRVSNTPTGTQTVSVTGTPTVSVSFSSLGSLTIQGTGTTTSKIPFNQTLNRLEFS